SFISALMERKALSTLAELWVAGARIDWSLLHSPVVPARISVPTYPFARERHWITVTETRKAQPTPEAASSHDLDLPEKVSQKETRQKETSQKGTQGELQSLAPVWKQIGEEAIAGPHPGPEAKLLVLLANPKQMAWIRRSYP